MKVSKHRSIVGIVFDGSRMVVAELRRTGNQIELRNTLFTSLTLDLMNSDPDLVGREIRNHLDNAGIRERKCLVCIPLKWILTLQLEIPESLSDEDRNNYINVQAERGFPFPPQEIGLSTTFFTTQDSVSRALVAALPIHYLNILQKALHAARLRPAGITMGLPSLIKSCETVNAIIMHTREDGIDIGMILNGGVFALRQLPYTTTAVEDRNAFDVSMIIRELRISLGSLPEGLQKNVRQIVIFGVSERDRRLYEEIKESVERIGMSIEYVTPHGEVASRLSNIPENMSPYVYIPAIGYLLNQAYAFEFLPPRIDRFRQLAGRISARGALWLAGTLLTIFVIVSLTFFIQYYQLSRLEKKWKSIEPSVVEIEKIQERLRQYRPWNDDSIQSLTILKNITMAFPENGTVWVKSLEIKDASNVVCSAEGRSNTDVLSMLDRLRKISGVENLQVMQLRGKDPMQFTFSFRWNGANHGL